jgi:acyl-coenzyme A thioesterase PaaI-like protein
MSDAFQDHYADAFAHCYGCGRLNTEGYQIKSYWEREESVFQSVCRFEPRPYHTGGFPEFVYGGLIASLVDCHSAGTAAAAQARAEGRKLGSRPLGRYVTASLKVDFIKPTPLRTINLRSRVVKMTDRKVIVQTTVAVDGVTRATGEAVMVKLRDPP